MARTNKTKYALLGVLNIRPGSGYDIKKFCDFSIAHFWNENYGHIYPVLRKMEEDGLVVRTIENSTGKPDRHVYCITDKGKKELHNWLKEPVEDGPLRYELLLKVFFSVEMPVADIKKIIKQSKKEYEARLRRYTGIERLLKSEEAYKNKPGLPYWLATVSFGKRHTQASIDWCKETLAVLEELSK